MIYVQSGNYDVSKDKLHMKSFDIQEWMNEW